MPNPATMNSLESFAREHVNTVIHVPDYKLRRQISLQQKESLVVEAFTAFDEMFYLHLSWTETGKCPDISLSLLASRSQKLVLELGVQSPYFTHISSDSTYAASAPQWTACNWASLTMPVEVKPPTTVIPLSVDRTPTHHNDGNISFEQTMTLAIVGTLWKLDDCPTDSLRCNSYRAKIQEVVEPPSASFLPRMIANIASIQTSTEAEDAEGTACEAEVALAAGSGRSDSEVEIRLDEGHIRSVHAFILKVHSPVFRRMLDGSMAEAAHQAVDMKQVSARQLDDFLSCLYQLRLPKEVQDDEERLMFLLTLADRYEVLALRDECASLLAARLSDANMADVLKVAEMHQTMELRAAALSFIASRPERIVAVMDTDSVSLRTSVREYLQVYLPTANAVVDATSTKGVTT